MRAYSSAHDCRLASLLADLLNDLLTCSLQVTWLLARLPPARYIDLLYLPIQLACTLPVTLALEFTRDEAPILGQSSLAGPVFKLSQARNNSLSAFSLLARSLAHYS